MSQPRRPTTGVILASLAAGACSDVAPTVPFSASADPRSSRSASARPTSPYSCMSSEQDRLIPGRYRYRRVVIHFPKRMIAANGAAIRYRYREGEQGSAPVAAANCLIPNTAEAIAYMDHFVARGRGTRVRGGPSLDEPSGRPVDGGVQGAIELDLPDPYVLPTVTVYATPIVMYGGSAYPTFGCVNYANCFDMSVSDAGGGDSWDPGETAEPPVESLGPPDCTKPQTPGSVLAAYCEKILPNEEQTIRIQIAIAKIAAKGGTCAAIAATAMALLEKGELRLFDGARYTTFGAAAPVGSGTDGFMVVATYWTDKHYDENNASSESPPRDLSAEIAHEADHLHGYHHQYGDRHHTPNQFACSDLT